MYAIEKADALLSEAHARGYRFPKTFPGFSAEVTWEGPDGAGAGTVVARLQEGVDLDVRDVPEWAEGQLRSIVSHRSARTYADGDGATPKRVAATSTLGQSIELDDEMNSSYLVGNGQISAVTRSAHGARFTIVVQGRTEAGDGTAVPTTFCVAFWDAEERLAAAEAYTDTYTDVSGVLLPESRSIVRADSDGLTARRLVLSDHAPLTVEVGS